MRTPVNKIVIHKVSDSDQDRINLIKSIIAPRILLTEVNNAISNYIHPRRIAISEWEGFPAVEVDYDRYLNKYYGYTNHTITINLVRELQELEDTVIPQIESSSIENKLELIYAILRDNIIDKLINCINK